MLRLGLHRALPAASHVFPAAARPGTGRHAPPGRSMGTHGRNEPREPLHSPKRAKEFIYRLHPAERTRLLHELQSFESMAIAQETQESSPPTAAQIRYGDADRAVHRGHAGDLHHGGGGVGEPGVGLGRSRPGRVRGGAGHPAGHAGSRSDAQTGRHVADPAQLAPGEGHRGDAGLPAGDVPSAVPQRRRQQGDGDEGRRRRGVLTGDRQPLHAARGNFRFLLFLNDSRIFKVVFDLRPSGRVFRLRS
uniref:Uncharacterized protein n=1 Tax=Salarias fasciatus TaxID=181472 RepID=A0A672GJF1_SALFA